MLCTSINFSDDAKEQYEYAPSGQMSRAIDGNGNETKYHYNSLGKIREYIDQDGEKELFQYDEEGMLSLYIDRDGRQVQYAYNVFGSPVYEKAVDAMGNNPSISTWHYDSIGRLTRAVCDGYSYEYIYNEYGNLKEKRSNGQRLVSYTYNTAGQITEIKDPAGVHTYYEYDLLGRRSHVYGDNGLEVRYTYDCLNRLQKIHFGNNVETFYTYDRDGNLSNLETRSGDTMLFSFAYAYDGNGNRTAKTGIQRMAAGAENMDISYSYNIRGQLLEEKQGKKFIRYFYDKSGNRIRKTTTEGDIIYLYNKKNQLLSESNADGTEKRCFFYDKQGSIIKETTKDDVQHYFYNSRHQRIRVETGDGRVQENRYDVEGLRYELIEDGKRTGFVYHNSVLLHEKGVNNQNQISYHLGVGIDALQSEQKLSYYHRDEQLNTIFLTGEHGNIQNCYSYDAFGVQIEEMEQFHNRIRYTSTLNKN